MLLCAAGFVALSGLAWVFMPGQVKSGLFEFVRESSCCRVICHSASRNTVSEDWS
jgi:hypothetical protein